MSRIDKGVALGDQGKYDEAKGQLLVFKQAIATIEVTDEPKGYKADI